MIKTISDIQNCTGCGACVNVCPHQAILMTENAEGFLYPTIDSEKCVNCGLCYQRCPSCHPVFKNIEEPDCYAAAAGDGLRQESSSGALFPVLAEYVLDHNGYVCGAAWNKDNAVEHMVISDKSDLWKLRGSKYLQSDTKKVYFEIEKLLKAQKLVLFSGTSCQVAGLNAFLVEDYDNLLTVDIVCHGVPSPKVYKKYLSELVSDKNEKVLNTNFRDKVNGWNPNLVTTTTTTVAEYTYPAKEDTYMSAFLQNICLRRSCGACLFAKFPRQADITLGDFWGIDKYSKKLNDGKGTSLVLLNTKKGEDYFKRIQKELLFAKKVPVKYAIKGNPCLVKSSCFHADRQGFFERLERYTLEDNMDIANGKKYDCGILNFWFGSNYGAMLTCYALQQTINYLGYVARVINYIPDRYVAKFKNSLSDKFSSNYLKMTDLCHDKSDLRELNNCADTFIVGSDQVWRHPYFWGLGGNIFQLNFADETKKKIAVAVSFGTDHYEGNYSQTELTKYYVKRFDAISVREDDGVDVCQNTFGVSATHILDPVFLAEKKEWDCILKNAKNLKKDFACSYVLDRTDLSENLLEELKKRYSNVIKMADGGHNGKYSVEEWLYNIKECEFLITDSFHGVCFAIIFNKPFICVANKNRGYSRFKSLFKMFGLEGRCVDNHSKLQDLQKLFEPIDYDKVNQILDKEREASLNWLRKALQSPKNKQEADLLELMQIKFEEDILPNLMRSAGLKTKGRTSHNKNRQVANGVYKCRLHIGKFDIFSKYKQGNKRIYKIFGIKLSINKK